MTPLALLAPIKAIVEALKPVLVFFHGFGVGWGTSIVMLTVCVRALMAPLMVKQFKSMQALATLSPELKKLQQKYKDDKQRQQQEVMAFYKENKVNPFASCLPIVMQLPFFMGLFYLLQTDLRFEICGQKAKPCGAIEGASGSEHFLFIPDLTDKATGAVLIVLIVLYIGSQLLSSLLTPSTGDRNQKLLMYALPFFFTIIIVNFPAGLIVYWITTNLWTVGQGYLLRRKLGPIRPLEPATANGAGSGGGLGGLLAQLRGQPAGDVPSEAKNGSAGGEGKAKPAKVAAPAGPRSGPPPPPPRKKKKRSGRRR